MAKFARWSFASDNSSPVLTYFSENHRQHSSTKAKFVTKSLQNAKITSGETTPRKTNNIKSSDGHHSKKNQTLSRHQHPPTPYTLPEYYYIINATERPSMEHIAAEREKIRNEFFSTYDVMTGVRIAATLGGFFGLMVFLVIYKSRGETQETMKALKDPKIAAVAAAVMQEEEDRELQEAMDATGLSIYPDDYPTQYTGYRRRRMMSLGNVSAPPIINRGYRFSSISGYNNLLGPSNRRFSYGGAYRKSSSVESPRIFSAYPIGEHFGIEDYFIESDGDEADDEFDQITNSVELDEHVQHYQLSVPPRGQEYRRCSNITCCSTESSYLERRCSAITLGLTPLPAISSRCPSTTNIWDFFQQPPDIQVIQATPKTSPCPSDRSDGKYYYDGCDAVASCNNRKWKRTQKTSLSKLQDPIESATMSTAPFPERSRRYLYDDIEEEELAETAALAQQINKLGQENRCLDDSYIKYTMDDTLKTNLLSSRRAPLASISSLKMSSIDYQDSDLRSLDSESIFVENYADTDDDMEQFSTDSDAINDTNSANVHTKEQSRRINKQMQSRRCSTVCVDIEFMPRDAATNTSKIDNNNHVQPKLNKTCLQQSNYVVENAMAHKVTPNKRTNKAEQGPYTLLLSKKNPNIISNNTELTHSASSIQSNNRINSNIDGNTKKPFYLSGRNNSYKCSKSTGNVANESFQQQHQQHKKINFVSEPLHLHIHGLQQLIKPHKPTKDQLAAISCQMLNKTSSDDNSSNSMSCCSASNNIITRVKESYIQSSMSSSILSSTTTQTRTVENIADNRISQQSPTSTSTSTTIVNPSVIFQMPVILSPQESNLSATTEKNNNPSSTDPICLPGTSKKWSKETLF